MFRRLFLALLISLAAVAPGFALDRVLTPEEKQLITEINQHNTEIRTMAGRFMQIDSRGQRAEGTFFLERPNKVNFRYGPPSREEIVSTGRGFYVLNRQKKTSYAYPQDSVPLRQFLGDQIDLFKANLTDVTLTDGYISISLSDSTPAGTVEVSLVFDTQTKELTQWTLTEPSGAELTVSLYDIVKNEDIPELAVLDSGQFLRPQFLIGLCLRQPPRPA